MVDPERPSAEPQREKGQPWVLPHEAGQQWLHMTEWHGFEEFPAHYPLGIMG